MSYRVISRFLDRVRGVYVNPGEPCPELTPMQAQRLIRARCIIREDGAPAGAAATPATAPAGDPHPSGRRGRRGRRAPDAPAAGE